MGICGSCWGSGKVTCISCGGRKYKSRMTNSGEVEINTCLVCGGTGKTRCNFCGGTGQIGVESTASIPTPKPRSPGSDPLNGRWIGANDSWYEFTRDGKKYRVVEASPLGKSGEGTATLKDDIARLEMNSMLIGKYNLELKMVGDTLEGTLLVMGIPTPVILYRG